MPAHGSQQQEHMIYCYGETEYDNAVKELGGGSGTGETPAPLENWRARGAKVWVKLAQKNSRNSSERKCA